MPPVYPKRFLFVFVTSILLTGAARAGGFENIYLGMKATSMGGAFTAVGSDASASFYNPGALTFLEFNQLQLGGAAVLQNTSYLSPYTGNFDLDKNIQVPFHLYGTMKIGEYYAVGLSVNTPFKYSTVWPEDWAGNYITTESGLNALYIQPAFSYMVTEEFGIGGGPVVAIGKLIHNKAIPFSGNGSEFITSELEGNATGFGFNIGLYYKYNKKLNLGLSYRSAVKLKPDGDVSFSHVPSSLVAQFPASASFETEFTLPSVISAGASLNLTQDLMICLDINYTTWNSFDSLEYKFTDQPHLDYGQGKFYKNSFAARVGAQYLLTDMITVRAGAAMDKSPVEDENVSPDFPDGDKYVLSLGGSLNFGENFSIDLAYMLENFREREVINSELGFAGTYKSYVSIFGLTLNYDF